MAFYIQVLNCYLEYLTSYNTVHFVPDDSECLDKYLWGKGNPRTTEIVIWFIISKNK